MAEGSHGVDEVRAWFETYLRAYAACCRGDSDDTRQLLEFFGVPLLLTTDATAVTLTGDDEVVGAVGQQIERLRAAGYDRTEMLDSETTMLNASTALHRAHFVWLRADGSEIARMGLAYLITHGVRGRRISALIVGTPRGILAAGHAALTTRRRSQTFQAAVPLTPREVSDGEESGRERDTGARIGLVTQRGQAARQTLSS